MHLWRRRPDEEILLIDRSFLCLNYAHYFNVPSYDAWLPRQDHTKAYHELELWLKVLQYNAPDRRGKKWLLVAASPVRQRARRCCASFLRRRS